MSFLDEFNLMMADASLRRLIEQYDATIQTFLDNNINPYDHPDWIRKMLETPVLGKAIIDNEEMTNIEKIDMMIKAHAERSVITPLLGRRGAGKTVQGTYILEEVHERYPNKNVVMLVTAAEIPDYIIQIVNPRNCPNNSVFFFDEASLTVNARTAMSSANIDISKMLAILRHRGISIIFASQHPALMDLNILRLCDCMLFKKPSWEELVSGDDKNKRMFSSLTEVVKLLMPREPNETLFTDGEKWVKMTTPLPSFWSEKLSKSYGEMTVGEMHKFIVQRIEARDSIKKITAKLGVRGINIDEATVKVYSDPGFIRREAKRMGENFLDMQARELLEEDG